MSNILIIIIKKNNINNNNKKILKDEGIFSLYKSLPPRLLSVVPMIGIQFGVYELMKRLLTNTPPPKKTEETGFEKKIEKKNVKYDRKKVLVDKVLLLVKKIIKK
jgi:hypothetical protein